MEMDDQLEKWLADELPPELLRMPLPDSFAAEVVDRFP